MATIEEHLGDFEFDDYNKRDLKYWTSEDLRLKVLDNIVPELAEKYNDALADLQNVKDRVKGALPNYRVLLDYIGGVAISNAIGLFLVGKYLNVPAGILIGGFGAAISTVVLYELDKKRYRAKKLNERLYDHELFSALPDLNSLMRTEIKDDVDKDMLRHDLNLINYLHSVKYYLLGNAIKQRSQELIETAYFE